MDYEAAADRLQEFIELYDSTFGPDAASVGIGWSLVTAPDEVRGEAQIVMRIVERLIPGKTQTIRARMDGEPHWPSVRAAVVEALSVAREQQSLDEMLGPPPGPELRADELDPIVWDAAKSFWQSGEYATAVEQAAKAVNAQIKARLGRKDVDEAEAVAAAFSTDPAGPGKPRLRLMEPDESKTFRSLQGGAVQFGQGCFRALRNPPSHEVDYDIPPQMALEQLAAFSLLSRWVGQAWIETNEEV